MNILILSTGRNFGGIESHSITLASALTDAGHRVVIGCSRGYHVWNNAVAAGIPVSHIPLRNSGDPVALARIVRSARRIGAGVIIANIGKEYWPAVVAARLLGIRVMIVRHQVDRLKRTTAWLLTRHADAVAAVSGAVRDALVESGVASGRIEVVYNAIDLGRFDLRRTDRKAIRGELGIGAQDIVLGYTGKINPGKGVFELLHAVHIAAAAHPSLRVLFVGDGPSRADLEAESVRLAMRDRVIFAGLRSDVERLYAAMDLFVLPSTCREAFGMVIIEAMAMGRPVIATDIGGIPEIVAEGATGLLVPPGDPRALAGAIARLLNDPGFAQRLAVEGRRSVEERFSAKALAAGFERLLGGRRSSA